MGIVWREGQCGIRIGQKGEDYGRKSSSHVQKHLGIKLLDSLRTVASDLVQLKKRGVGGSEEMQLLI